MWSACVCCCPLDACSRLAQLNHQGRITQQRALYANKQRLRGRVFCRFATSILARLAHSLEIVLGSCKLLLFANFSTLSLWVIPLCMMLKSPQGTFSSTVSNPMVALTQMQRILANLGPLRLFLQRLVMANTCHAPSSSIWTHLLV
jgi:hypothetical protein